MTADMGNVLHVPARHECWRYTLFFSHSCVVVNIVELHSSCKLEAATRLE
jgi:hypothetical protein